MTGDIARLILRAREGREVRLSGQATRSIGRLRPSTLHPSNFCYVERHVVPPDGTMEKKKRKKKEKKKIKNIYKKHCAMNIE
ncbi:hypothetical protein PUN28_019598 [Cardiocondyla obscurior]|uniref:Ribosomal protein L19 n=1 Tax=Cardiocondyla obscurior TaxID=286306 RepID=A0AAW2E9G9_9HYME